MAKKSVKKETKQKKSTPKKTAPKKTAKTNQTTLKESEKKGKLTVSQRDRDEIDAVVDTLWSFVNALKNSWNNSVSISPIFFKPRSTFQINSGLPEKSITHLERHSSIGT